MSGPLPTVIPVFRPAACRAIFPPREMHSWSLE
mgnify:CR=1 FL=1